MTPGPPIRTDLVDVYVFARTSDDPSASLRFLQLRRTREPQRGAWHPVMGKVRAGETAVRAALRELREETGLDAHSGARGMWFLGRVFPYYNPAFEAVVLSPRFAVRVDAAWEPTLNAEHDAWRWADRPDSFVWSSQRACAAEIAACLVDENAEAARALVVDRKATERRSDGATERRSDGVTE